MHRTLVIALVAALAGCAAKTGSVEFAMKSMVGGDNNATFEPTSVEVNHEDDGWIKIPLADAQALAQAIEGDAKASFATEDLPKGTYNGVRVGYVHVIPPAPAPTKSIDTTPKEDSKTVDTRKQEDSKTVDLSKSADSATVDTAPATETRTEGMLTNDKTFCIGKDGGEVVIRVNENDAGELKLRLKTPEC